MSKLYKYRGTVSGSSSSDKKVVSIILHDIHDSEKAPTRIEVFGGMAKYIYEIEMTDAEERYLNADYFFDNNLYLHRIEIPSSNEYTPAKVITQGNLLSEELVIFGPQEYIETRTPEPMDNEQFTAWCRFRVEHRVNGERG